MNPSKKLQLTRKIRLYTYIDGYFFTYIVNSWLKLVETIKLYVLDADRQWEITSREAREKPE